MTETPSSAQHSANAAVLAKGQRLSPVMVAGGILFALALAVVMLRLHRLSELPSGIEHGEGLNGVDALRVLQGEHAVFFPAAMGGHEGLVVYAIAMAISVLGPTELALRLPTALASAGTVFAVFWLGRLLFGREESGRATPWRGLLVGGVGAGLLAVSIGQTILGRNAFRANYLPLLLSLCLALLWGGWMSRVRRGGTWWRIALAGVCAGLLPYTYIPARFTPFLFLFFGLSFALPLRTVTGERAPAGTLKRNLQLAGVFVVVAGLVAAPILVYFALHPEHFLMRSNQVLVFHPDRNQGDSLGTFLGSVWGHLLAFGFRGDLNGRHNFAGQPMLNPWEAFFFWLGVGMAVWRWQRPAYRLLLLWLVILLLPTTLARDINEIPPNTLRMIGAAPAIYLLTGVGVWEAFRFLIERCRALKWRANLLFRENDTKAAIALGVVVSGAVLVQGVITYRTYFQKWAAAPETYEAYQTDWTELARVLNAQPSDANMLYAIPGPYWRYGFAYLYRGAAPVYLYNEIMSALAAMENVSTVKVVSWNCGGDDTECPALLLGQYGRYLGSEERAGLHIHNFGAFYEHLEPLTVYYDGGISLHGLALGKGEEQLPLQPIINLEEDRSLWVALQWQCASGLDIDYGISLRLHDADGGRLYQDDAVLRKWNLTPTSYWSADDLVVSVVHLDFPAELPPGEYDLRLVVYDTESLTPTVELGVWEPEVVLARVRLAEVR